MAARWRLVRKAFIRTETDRDSTFQTNNFKFIDDPEVDDSERKYSKIPTMKKFSFLQVVREATQRNANVGRKPRPTLMKFLEKFDTLDIPACVPRTDQWSRRHSRLSTEPFQWETKRTFPVIGQRSSLVIVNSTICVTTACSPSPDSVPRSPLFQQEEEESGQLGRALLRHRQGSRPAELASTSNTVRLNHLFTSGPTT